MCDWNQLLTKKRYYKDTEEDDVFQKDIRRVIYSSAFRRMQGKTQMFLNPRIDTIRNRLTHTLEVANVGASIAAKVAESLDVPSHQVQDFIACTYAACLLHDIGNPPFGHKGEESIRKYFSSLFADEMTWDILQAEGFKESFKSDFEKFDGNAQGFRIMTKLANWKDAGGMRLSYATMAAFMKYPHSSNADNDKAKRGKFSFFLFDKKAAIKTFQEMGFDIDCKGEALSTRRHPISYIVEAADDICYTTTDLEDAYRVTQQAKIFDILKNMAEVHTFPDGLRDANDQVAYMRSKAIDRLIDYVCVKIQTVHEDIKNGSYREELVKGNRTGNALEQCLHEAEEQCNDMYDDPDKLKMEYGGFKVIQGLLKSYVTAYIRLLRKENDTMDVVFLKTLPPEFRWQVLSGNGDKSMSPNMALPAIMDYVALMTDNYATNLYQRLKGIA